MRFVLLNFFFVADPALDEGESPEDVATDDAGSERVGMSISHTSKPKKVVCCGAHQVFLSCTNPCMENTCANWEKDPKNKRSCPEYCKLPGKCVCKNGYYMNNANECVRSSKCRESPAPTEALDCNGKHMELVGCLYERDRRTCKKLLSRKKSRKSKRKDLCKINQCNCKEGFYLSKYKVCVTASECKKNKKPRRSDGCPGPNEVRVKRWRRIDENSCYNRLVKRHKRNKKNKKIYKNICVCVVGYLRDLCGRCVEPSQCFSGAPCECSFPCGSNETWAFHNECNAKRCPKPRYLSPTEACRKDGNYGCDCREGYARSPDGQCVLLEDCPKFPQRPIPQPGLTQNEV